MIFIMVLKYEIIRLQRLMTNYRNQPNATRQDFIKRGFDPI